MSYTDDPVWDAHCRDAEEAKWLEKLPKCSDCGEPIADDYCYEFNGVLICEDCLKYNHRKETENYIEQD